LSRDVTVDTIRKWHRAKGWADVGYHYVVRKNGGIEIGRDLSLVGAHCLGRNHDSVGVCITGDFWKYEPTLSQINACNRIYHELCQIYYKTLGIEFHRPEYHKQACPGPKMDRADFTECVRRAIPHNQEWPK